MSARAPAVPAPSPGTPSAGPTVSPLPPPLPPLTALVAAAAVVGTACWRVGEPTPDDARVTWTAYPETVRVGETFSFEAAGPVSRNSCARLDTVVVSVTDTALRVSARRSLFDTMCPDDRVSFYHARPLSMPAAGRYPVITAEGKRLGALIAVDSGDFSLMRTVGEGTVRTGGGCLFFGPGWANNQRPFALEGAPESLRSAADTDRVVWVRGTLYGFSLCGNYGSRPRILVDSARVTPHRAPDYYYPSGPVGG